MKQDYDFLELAFTWVLLLILGAVVVFGGAMILREGWFLLTTGNFK